MSALATQIIEVLDGTPEDDPVELAAETYTAFEHHRTALTAQRRANAQLAGEVQALRAAGDQLQSEASRLAAWVRRCQADGELALPYEEQLALTATLDGVEAWTRARRRSQ